MSTYVIGDVHGCADELEELLEKLRLSDRDRVIFAGDLVDRGPESSRVIGIVRRIGASVVRGNHDEFHIDWRSRWLRHEARRRATGKRNPMQPMMGYKAAVHETLSDSDLAWLGKQPFMIEPLPGWLVVHAGLFPGVPLIDQDPKHLTRIRFVNQDGSLYKGNIFQPEPGVRRWAELWTGPQNVVYGHAVYDLDEPTIDNPAPGVWCFGIDTGCCFGGHLTAMCLETKEFVQVKAKKEYSTWRGKGST